MVRFRPNLVVAGGRPGPRTAGAGSASARRSSGGQGLRPVRDPDHRRGDGGARKEPTYTLARHRRWDGAVWFGMNLVPETPGATLHVGDEVEILDAVDASDGPPR